MNNKKNTFKLIFNLDKVQHLHEKFNKKLNTNKLIKKIESLTKRRVDIINLLNPKKYRVKLKSIFNKKLILPSFLTSDSFLKSIRLIFQNRFDINAKSIETNNKKKNIRLNNLSIKNKLSSLFDFIPKPNIKKLNIDYLTDSYDKLKLSLINIKLININSLFRNNKIKLDKDSHSFCVAFYSDHLLTVSSLTINRDNQILVNGFVEVPVPGDIIGDSLVENKVELANIFLDLFSLLKLNRSPLLIILSSSFFKINTFMTSELKQISNTDSTVQSKSPYLPNDTFVEFFNKFKNSSEQKLVRTTYTNRKLIESWTDTLEILDIPIIGITPCAPNIFDLFKTKILDKTTVLIEIESAKTIVSIGRDSSNLTTHNIPYGNSLYISDKNPVLSNNYFLRVQTSIELIMSEYEEKMPEYIFTYGKGLDDLVKKNTPLPNGFKRLSDINLVDYSFSSNKNQINVSASNSINSTIEVLALVTSCL